MELACIYCKTPAYTVIDGNALCFDHYLNERKRWAEVNTSKWQPRDLRARKRLI